MDIWYNIIDSTPQSEFGRLSVVSKDFNLLTAAVIKKYRHSKDIIENGRLHSLKKFYLIDIDVVIVYSIENNCNYALEHYWSINKRDENEELEYYCETIDSYWSDIIKHRATRVVETINKYREPKLYKSLPIVLTRHGFDKSFVDYLNLLSLGKEAILNVDQLAIAVIPSGPVEIEIPGRIDLLIQICKFSSVTISSLISSAILCGNFELFRNICNLVSEPTVVSMVNAASIGLDRIHVQIAGFILNGHEQIHFNTVILYFAAFSLGLLGLAEELYDLTDPSSQISILRLLLNNKHFDIVASYNKDDIAEIRYAPIIITELSKLETLFQCDIRQYELEWICYFSLLVTHRQLNTLEYIYRQLRSRYPKHSNILRHMLSCNKLVHMKRNPTKAPLSKWVRQVKRLVQN